MLIEVIGAVLIGAAVFWLVLAPLVRTRPEQNFPPEPLAEEETRRGQALLALKEIEFDRATGKLSDRDYADLKERYSAEALTALLEPGEPPAVATADPEALIAARLNQLRSASASGTPAPPACATCGPRPEPDAVFCSHCGLPLTAPNACSACGRTLDPDSRFCSGCGTRVAA